MINLKMRPLGKLSAGWKRGLILLTVLSFFSLVVISCRTVNRAIVMLPNVPGATYIGSKECEQCHQELYRDFRTADHALLTLGGPNGTRACTSVNQRMLP